MTYKALYRTYRPQTFEEVVGQDIIVKTLQNSIKNNKIGHAYLFCGPRGTGKTSIARIFAKTLNCPNAQDAKPCNECAICKEITTGTSPDVIEIDAASNNGVDEIRELRDKVKFLPAGTKYKVYIIDEVHMLSTSAFNALLKTLEEPPAHAIFILATTEPNKVLPTIISRCQRYDFKSLTNNEIYDRLALVCNNEGIKFEEDALMSIAMAADGGMRDGLSLLDQAISLSDDVINDAVASSVTGSVDKSNLLTLARYIEEKKISEALKQITELHNSGRDTQKITNGLLGFYRDILMAKAKVTKDDDPRYQEFADEIDQRKIYFYIDALNDVQSKLLKTNTPNIYLEVCLIKMISASSEELDYGKRILDLEQKLDNYSTSEGSTSSDGQDSKRLRLLEEKFNNLLTELSKLELFRLTDRVKALEENKSEATIAFDEENIKDLNVRVNKIIEDLELLKVMQESLRTQVDNAQTGGIDDDILQDRIETNLKKIKISADNSEFESYVNKRLDELEKSRTYVQSNNDYDYQDKIDALVQEINELKNRPVVSSNDNKEVITKEFVRYDDERINALELKVNNLSRTKDIDRDYEDLKNRVNELEEIVLSIEAKESEVKPVTYVSGASSDLELRISKMESNIYRIMSGMLNPQPAKKNKQKVDEKQMSLWSDEDFGRNEKPAESVKADFEDFAKTKDEEITEDATDVTEEYASNDEVSSFEDESTVDEVQDVVEDNEELVEEFEETKETLDESDEAEEIEETPNLFDSVQEEENEPVEEDINPVEEEETGLFEESLEDFYSQDIESENKSDDVKEQVEENQTNLFDSAIDASDATEEMEASVEETNATDPVEVVDEKVLEEERIEKERLEKEAELKRLEEERQAQENRMHAEEQMRERELARAKAEEELEQKKEEMQKIEAARASGGADLDEYERYDVKVLERILNDARNPEYRDEKGRLDRVWKELLRLVPLDKRGVAEILAEGMITAVGNHEFVLIYSNASICNQVMNRRFKKVSLKLLYDILGTDYNYFAITQEVWLEKRSEYANQYSVGTKYPTLSPIGDPNLRVVIDNDDADSDSMIRKSMSLFGDNLNVK